MLAELLPGHLLDQFLQRADTAGQRHEGVRAFEHQPLALVHVVGDDQFRHPAQGDLAGAEEARNDAGDGAAVVEHGFGDRAHQPDRTAAIDQPDAAFRQQSAENRRGFKETRIGAGAGAAIDADRLDFAHAGDVAPRNDRVKMPKRDSAAPAAPNG